MDEKMMNLLKNELQKSLLFIVSVFIFGIAAEAQTASFVGDFSSITPGTIRPVRLQLHNSTAPNTIHVFLVSAVSNNLVTTGLGFSFEMFTGPYEHEFIVRVTTDSFGNGYSEQFYMKSLATVSPLAITTCGSSNTNVQCVTQQLGAATPPPSVTPTTTPTPSISLNFGDSTDVGVGEIRRATISLYSPDLINGSYTMYSNSTSFLFSDDPDGPYAPTWSLNTQVGPDDHEIRDLWVKAAFATNGSSQAPKIFACYTTIPCAATPPIRVMNVASARLATYADTSMATPNIALDNNPNAGGGLRIFPEKISLSHSSPLTAKRRNVTVIARLNEPVANKRIYFKVFDVDDVSTDDQNVDPNLADGGDNRSLEYGFGSVGNLSTYATTDANGEARATLMVGQQPGDNYRVIASFTGGQSLPPVIRDANVVGGNVHFQTNLIPEGTAGVNKPAVATKMLTVWRRLHIERDSMGTVNDNLVTGTVASAVVEVEGEEYSDIVRLTLNVNPAYTSKMDTNRFELGEIRVKSIVANMPDWKFPVLSSSASSVRILGNFPPSLVGKTFTLYDDDNFDQNSNTPGDNGVDVPNPSTGWMQDSDDPALNRFAPAYIRPTYDLPSGEVPFLLNIPKASATGVYPTTAELTSVTRFDNYHYRQDRNFWIVYLLQSFQADTRSDEDPDSSRYLFGYLGMSSVPVGAFTFIETESDAYNFYPAEGDSDYVFYRDRRYTPVRVVAEMLNASGVDGGFMSETENAFSGGSLNLLRSSLIPTSGEW